MCELKSESCDCSDLFWPRLFKLPYWVGFCKGHRQSARTHGDAPAKCNALNAVKADILFSDGFFGISSRRRSTQNSQDQSCESRSMFTLSGMTFNNNNNRRCLDLLAAMATGIRQGLLLCWWCPQKNRGANWQRMWDGAVFQRCGGQPCSVEFHRKGQTRLLLLAQSLREIHRLFVYSAQKEAALERDVCLWFRP